MACIDEHAEVTKLNESGKEMPEEIRKRFCVYGVLASPGSIKELQKEFYKLLKKGIKG